MILLRLLLSCALTGLISASGYKKPDLDFSEVLMSWLTTKYDVCFGSNFGFYRMQKMENAIAKCDMIHQRKFHSPHYSFQVRIPNVGFDLFPLVKNEPETASHYILKQKKKGLANFGLPLWDLKNDQMTQRRNTRYFQEINNDPQFKKPYYFPQPANEFIKVVPNKNGADSIKFYDFWTTGKTQERKKPKKPKTHMPNCLKNLLSLISENINQEQEKYFSSFTKNDDFIEDGMNTPEKVNYKKIKNILDEINQLEEKIAMNKMVTPSVQKVTPESQESLEDVDQVADVKKSISLEDLMSSFINDDNMKNKSKSALKFVNSDEHINKTVTNDFVDEIIEESEEPILDVMLPQVDQEETSDDNELIMPLQVIPSDIMNNERISELKLALDASNQGDSNAETTETIIEKADKHSRKKRAVKYHYYMNTMNRQKQALMKLSHSSDISLCVLQELGIIDANMNLNFEMVVELNNFEYGNDLIVNNYGLKKNLELCYDVAQEFVPFTRHMDPTEVKLMKIKKFLECQNLELDKHCLWSLRILGMTEY